MIFRRAQVDLGPTEFLGRGLEYEEELDQVY